MGPKKRKLIDDEAECAEDDLSESSEDDDDSSLDGFIVADGELSDSNYDMEDSEKEEPVPVAAPKKRLGQRKVLQRQKLTLSNRQETPHILQTTSP